MNGDVLTFVSALAQDMDCPNPRQQEIETAAAYETLKTLHYTGPVLLHFQHGTARAIQLLHPVTWKLT